MKVIDYILPFIHVIIPRKKRISAFILQPSPIVPQPPIAFVICLLVMAVWQIQKFLLCHINNLFDKLSSWFY